ncbi:MAG: DUF998 domain-containing protein [Candidatus Bathyarchaeota archaeon]|nr:DUF998 domain-containing protein [Candidatus Bathyarchaeota archaeon]MCX8177891.1 DUF998 domain-containing protein [Candidatus Bathyarchaeota archaeon]MDW8194516.1 DUF998 domain-containing protein [Nitrososphaerota archaeon]
MKLADEAIAGAIMFVGASQFVLCMIVAESLYPSYSISDNYISDLGVGPSSLIFNSSVFLLGLAAVISVYFLRSLISDYKAFQFSLMLCGVGAMGVGVFPENFGFIHTIFSLFAFLFGALSAIASFKIQKPPLSHISIILGVLSIAALLLFAFSEYCAYIYRQAFSLDYLGLGKGGLERLIAYPIILWAMGFSGHLIGESKAYYSTMNP